VPAIRFFALTIVTSLSFVARSVFFKASVTIKKAIGVLITPLIVFIFLGMLCSMEMCFLHRMELFSLHLLVVLPNKLHLPQVWFYPLIYFFPPHFLLHMSLRSIQVVPSIIASSSPKPAATNQPLPHEPSLSPSRTLPSPVLSDTSSPHMVTSPNTTLDSSPPGSFLSPSSDAARQSDAFLPSSTIASVAPLSPSDVSTQDPATEVLTRSQTGSLKPKAFPDYHLYYSLNILLRLYILWLYLLNHLAIQ
jgi:hypothetical protein